MLQLAGAVQSSAIGTVLSLALMIAGAVLAGVGVLRSFRDVPVNAAYGRAGLYVGELDEQHP